MTYCVRLATPAAAAEIIADSQPFAAQGVAVAALFVGQDWGATGANYFVSRKTLPHKGLRHKRRQEYKSVVDNCLEPGIMAGAKNKEVRSQKSESTD